MKHFVSLFFLCFIAFCVHAQVARTVEVVAPGSLCNHFTQQEQFTVTKLILTGNIDVRDFKFMKDSMPFLSDVDLSESHIMAYSGPYGTSMYASEYAANEIPDYGFAASNELGYLKKIKLPATLTGIGEHAFAFCTGLDTIHLSEKVVSLDWMSFGGSSAVLSIDPENAVFCDVDGMLLDKSKHLFIYCPTSHTGPLVLPETVDSIAGNAFCECQRLESVELPKSVRYIGYDAFYYCTGLKTLIVNNTPDKIKLEEEAFYGVHTDSCVLDVLYGTISKFSAAYQWSNFRQTKEHSIGMVLNTLSVNLFNLKTTETLYVRSNVNWTVQSDQTWLTLDKNNGMNSDTIQLNASTNTTTKNRVAHVLISGEGIAPQTVTVTQSAPERVVHCVSGGLANALKDCDMASIMMLKLDGTMNASDFFTINDSMPMLTSIDLNDVQVTACTIKSGYSSWQETYLADEIPQYAFDGAYYCRSWKGLSRIILPKNTKTIHSGNFRSLFALKEILVPDSVTSIWSEAFSQCFSLTKLELGKSVSRIDVDAFMNCHNLKTVVVHSEVPIPFNESSWVFENVNLKLTQLYVPYGTKKRYSEADLWNEFGTIIEAKTGLFSETSKARLADMEGSSVRVGVVSTTPWTVQNNQPWLQVTPASGTGSDSITLIAQANMQQVARTAIVSLITAEFGTRTIQVVQAASPKSIQMKAGELNKILTSQEKKSISNLVLSGTMDARDFRVLHDSLPLLNSLDLRAVKILEYNGDGALYYYNSANQVPSFAFYRYGQSAANDQLEHVFLPLTLTSISYNAFTDCINLMSISLPNNINQIGIEAFSGCSNLAKVDMPSSLKVLGIGAFKNCVALTEMTLGDSLLVLPLSAFEGCKSLKSISLSKSLLVIDEQAFKSCKSLTEVIIPPSVTMINYYAFQSCTSLRRIVLSASLQSIGRYAFQDCYNMAEIDLPGSVNSIGWGAFNNCGSLNTVYVNALDALAMNLEDDVFGNLNLKTCSLHVPYQTKPMYALAQQWRDFGTIVEATNGLKLNVKEVILAENAGSHSSIFVRSNAAWTVTSNQAWLSVADKGGFGNDSIRFTATENPSLSIRKAIVTVVAEGVEPQCVLVTQSASMKVVTISAGGLSKALTKQEKLNLSRLTIKGVMDASDFKTIRDSLPNLTNLNLAETTVASYYGRDGVSSDYWDNYAAQTIPAYAFSVPYNSGNMLLKEVVLPTSITDIGNSAFAYCYALESVVVPNSVTTIGNEAFSNCSKLKYLTLGTSVKTIAGEAFESCYELTEVLMPNSVESIESYAFNGCHKLTNLVFGTKLVSIGSQAFYGCERLVNVLLPNSLKTIGYNAFYACNQLSRVSLPASLTFVDEYALGCSSLQSISVYARNPLSLSASTVFYNVNKSECILSVPAGTKKLYSTASVWKDFTNIVEMEAALPEEALSGFRVYPNPFSDGFSLQGLEDGTPMTVVDMKGNVLISKMVFNNERIEAGQLANGMYLIRLQTPEGVVIRKMLKK